MLYYKVKPEQQMKIHHAKNDKSFKRLNLLVSIKYRNINKLWKLKILTLIRKIF